MARDTRHRILVASLLLFNEHGVPRTTINDIADEIDISPGNLHYHFRKKEDIVDALTAEFQADARKVLHPPESDNLALDDFWWFLHQLLELKGAYGFMLTDTEVLADDYPKVARALRHFARAVNAAFELYLLGLVRNGYLNTDMAGVKSAARNLAIIALMSERFDELIESSPGPDDAAIGVARSILGLLKPLATPETAAELEELATHYAE
jgi:AcrR family transcriptional regulator